MGNDYTLFVYCMVNDNSINTFDQPPIGVQSSIAPAFIFLSLDEFMILVIKVVGVTEMNKVDLCVWEQNKRSCFSLFKRVESYVTVKGVKCLNPTRGNL